VLPTPWLILEYSKGQYIIPHADGADYLQDPTRRQIAALSLWLEVPEQGGEFYAQLDGFDRDWTIVDGIAKRRGLDAMNSTYDYSVTPQWRLSGVRPGGAILFGSELVHGTLPVLEGRALKALSFLTVSCKGAF
jgi:hypothetical protein